MRLEERKKGGFRSWIGFSADVTCWLLEVLEEARDIDFQKRKWPRRKGETSYISEIRENDAGRYLRISRVRRGDENRSHAFSVPCGDNNYYWSIIPKEIRILLHDNLLKKSVQ